ncbi:MAG: GldG family protein [Leptospiraceae bacterium]|nr:GldG family protein [Leptospiraceae bacterium]MDW8306093.1 GldG family protein [Leptospiraceae bacterium]
MQVQDLIKNFQESKKVTTVLLVALFLALNYLSYGIYLRFDLSQEGQFRITQASKNVLRNLQDPVIVEAFFSTDVPPAFVQQIKNIKDFLKEYAANSRGKLKLLFLDPDNDKDARERASALGIQPTPIGQLDVKKQEFRSAYYSVALSYGEKTETIANVLQSRELEYELTARIRKMSNPQEKRIGFLTNHGPFQLFRGQNIPLWHTMQSFTQRVQLLYGDIMQIDTNSQEIPPEVSVMLVIAPDRFSELDRLRFDQFLMRGGSLIVAASPMNVNLQNFMASVGNTEAQEFLRHYGIDTGSDMLLDLASRGSLPWLQQIDFFTVQPLPYPFWILIGRSGLNQEHPIGEGLFGLFVPYTSSVKIDGNVVSAEKGFKTTFLAKTSAETIAKQNFVFLDPRQVASMLETFEETRTDYQVAVYVRGKFPSYFANRPLPKDAPKDFTLQKEATADATIVALGSPYVFTDLPVVSVIGCRECLEANLSFLLSAVDVLNGMEELAQLRKKQKLAVSQRAISKTQQDILTFLAYAIPLGILVGYGARRVMRRKKLSREGVSVMVRVQGGSHG